MLRARTLLAALVLASLSAGPMSAQEPLTPTGAAPGLTAERLDLLRQEIAAADDLSEDARKAADEACQQADANLRLAAELADRAKTLGEETLGVQARVASVKGLLGEQPKPNATLERTPLPELEQQLVQLEMQLVAQKKRLAAAEAEPQARAQRRKDIRTRIVAIQQLMADEKLASPSLGEGESSLLGVARNTERATHLSAIRQEMATLESELAQYDAGDAVDLLRLQTDLMARETSQTEKLALRVKEQIKVLREAAAEDSVRKARLEAIVATPVLKSYAERNHELAETARAIAHELSQAEQDLKAAQEAHTQLNKQFKATRGMVETVGLTSSVGALLRNQRITLPDTTLRRGSISARRALIDETQYQQFEYGDESEELRDLDEMVQAIVARAGVTDAERTAFLESAARDLLKRKRDYLDSLLKTCKKYFDTLIDLDATDQQIVTLSDDYTAFIDERVLWIRSGKLLTKGFGVDAPDAWLISPTKWAEIGQGLLDDAIRRPVAYGGGVLLFFFLLLRGRGFRKHLGQLGETAAKVNCRSIRPTLEALMTTSLIAVLWPAACLLLAWRVGRLAEMQPFAGAVSQGLVCLGCLWAPLEVWRQFCRPRGLGEAHFGWSVSATQSIRRRLRWFTFLALPFAFVTTVLLSIDKTHGHDSVERISFLIGMLALGLFAFRMLGSSGVLREHIQKHPGGWLGRLRLVWPWLAAATPVSLAGLTFAGYYYTAQVLSWRLFATCCFIGVLVTIRSLLLRLLFLRRRALSMDQARERAAAAAAAAAEGDQAAPAVAGFVSESPKSDLSEHSQQTRRLVSTGMLAASLVGVWLIWVQVLPALGMLDRYPLWNNGPPVAAVQAAPAPMPPGMPAAKQTEATTVSAPRNQADEVVTLSDLALAILIAFVTFVVARNGPGLLEMSVLQQLPLDASVRYAITTLVSYAIVLFGVVVSCSTIGLQWSQVQWLATALTFGLAFGLQEMFANFVAGLIILLERPIRVGDVVTVDDVTGVVSRIRIRATSITNWDRKEYVVPNKEFITGRLLNWTLSDKINRIVINIGVAYGSDTDQARKLLLEVANNHPLVMNDPPPMATFEGFGDNSLNLVLRSYLATLDDRLETIHQLHTEIDKAFRAAKIEIAFPQRDLHIRSAPQALQLSLDGDQKTPSQANEAA